MNGDRWRQVRRWVFPSWRRLIGLTLTGLALVGLIYWARSLWLPFVAQWQYWHLVALRERAGAKIGPSYRDHPLSFELPPPLKLLEDGRWAAESTKATLETLRRLYPQDAEHLDYHLACWEFWSGDPAVARQQFEKRGRPLDLVAFALRVEDLPLLSKLADDPAVAAVSRARAWVELARRAQTEGRGKEAATAHLKSLEYAVGCGRSPATVEAAWEAVRVRLGTEIGVADYEAALRRMAQRTNEPGWLEQIMFELGKLKMLAEEAGEKEAHNAKS